MISVFWYNEKCSTILHRLLDMEVIFMQSIRSYTCIDIFI
jgi:hypothetical protein